MSLPFLLVPVDGPAWSWAAAAVAALGSRAPIALGGARLAALIGVSSATARRDLAAAAAAGGIVRDQRGGWVPGPGWAALRATSRMVGIPSSILGRSDLTRTAKVVAAKIHRDCGRWAHSVASLANDLGVRKATISAALAKLERLGMLLVEGVRSVARDRLGRAVRVPVRRVRIPSATAEAPASPPAPAAEPAPAQPERSKAHQHALTIEPARAQKRAPPAPSALDLSRTTAVAVEAKSEDGPRSLGALLGGVLQSIRRQALPEPAGHAIDLRAAAASARHALASGEPADAVLERFAAGVRLGDRERGGWRGMLARMGLRADRSLAVSVLVIAADIAAAQRVRDPIALLRRRLERLARTGLRAAVSRSCPASIDGAFGRLAERGGGGGAPAMRPHPWKPQGGEQSH